MIRNLFNKAKPSWASLCSVAFKDKQGRRYYSYNDMLDMSILRKGEMEKYLIELRYGSDLSDVCEAMKEALGAADKKGNMNPDLPMIGYLVQEIIDRKKMLVVPEIMLKIIATTFIREDENPVIIDEEIMDQKLATFKTELQHGGLAHFFHSAGFHRLIGLYNISINELTQLMNESLRRTQSLKRILSSSGSTLQHG